MALVTLHLNVPLLEPTLNPIQFVGIEMVPSKPSLPLKHVKKVIFTGIHVVSWVELSLRDPFPGKYQSPYSESFEGYFRPASVELAEGSKQGKYIPIIYI